MFFRLAGVFFFFFFHMFENELIMRVESEILAKYLLNISLSSNIWKAEHFFSSWQKSLLTEWVILYFVEKHPFFNFSLKMNGVLRTLFSRCSVKIPILKKRQKRILTASDSFYRIQKSQSLIPSLFNGIQRLKLQPIWIHWLLFFQWKILRTFFIKWRIVFSVI